MHPLFQKAHAISHTVIGAAIEVHRIKGPGLIESIYEKCLRRELELRGLKTICQRQVRIEYKGMTFEEPLRFDVLVEDCLLLELKSVEQILPIQKAQLLSYMKLLNIPLGLLINFHETKLTDGLHRLILPGADREVCRQSHGKFNGSNKRNKEKSNTLLPLRPSVERLL